MHKQVVAGSNTQSLYTYISQWEWVCLCTCVNPLQMSWQRLQRRQRHLLAHATLYVSAYMQSTAMYFNCQVLPYVRFHMFPYTAIEDYTNIKRNWTEADTRWAVCTPNFIQGILSWQHQVCKLPNFTKSAVQNMKFSCWAAHPQQMQTSHLSLVLHTQLLQQVCG